MKSKIISELKSSVRTIPDFPVPGIMFRDVTTLMKNAKTFNSSCDLLAESAGKIKNYQFVAGIEARGFIYAAVLAEKLNKGLVLLRKPGKLPSETSSITYDLEYGQDRLEMHSDSIVAGEGYLVVDDLLATGGTAEAACRLIEKGGAHVSACLFLVELPDLQGREKLGKRKVISLIEFEGE